MTTSSAFGGKSGLSIQGLIADIETQNVYSETEVRTKVAIPLLKLLGYPDEIRAEEFPIYAYEGKKLINAKAADIVLFDSGEFNNHRQREGRIWVQNHSLIVVELKKDAEPIQDDTQGQTQFYAMWARTQFYIITNGKEIAIYSTNYFLSDRLCLRCNILELPSKWAQIKSLIGYDVVLANQQNHNNANVAPKSHKYEEYLKTTLIDLDSRMSCSLERKISLLNNLPFVPFPLKLAGKTSITDDNEIYYTDLFDLEQNIVLLGQPGAGKTFLVNMLQRETIARFLQQPLSKIPIILQAKLWKRNYHSIVEGIINEVEPFVPSTSYADIEDDLKNGLFILLVDGMDEVLDSSDILYNELLRISRYKDIMVIVTCRTNNYCHELDDSFSTYTIEPLTDDQIEQYAGQVLQSYHDQFLYRLGPSLRELVHNPLFLFMTVQIIASSPNYSLPKNKAELYTVFTNYLINDWKKSKAMPMQYKLDSEFMNTILAEYALETFRQNSSEHVFNNIILRNFPANDLFDIKQETFMCGFILPSDYGPNFSHPSFHEYFTARCLSKYSNEGLKNVINEKHCDRSFNEVFAFLAGLLQEQQRQSILFNCLEEKNLDLYRHCLEARFRVDHLSSPWPENFIYQYFDQLRESYLRIINNSFPKLRNYFHPWFGADPEKSKLLNVNIEGSMDPSIPAITYKFGFSNDPGTAKISVKTHSGTPILTIPDQQNSPAVPIINFRTRDGCGFYNLGMREMGIDSAREVALDEVRKRIKEIIDDKLLFNLEGPALACEFINIELKELFPYLPYLPKEITGLSLYTHSIEEIIKRIGPYKKVIGFSHSHGVKEVRFPLLFYYLFQLEKQNINPTDFMLPLQDIHWEAIPPEKRFIWSVYSDQQLCARVGKYYDLYQESYRSLVEGAFSKIKDYLYFYRIGPVRFHATVWRQNVDVQGFGGVVYVKWEPIANDEDRRTVVEITNERLELGEFMDYQTASNKLRQLSRESEILSLGSSSLLNHHLGSKSILHQEVYQQIRDDLNVLLGKP